MPHRHDAGYISDYPDMVEPAFILFDGKGGGEFVFGCVTGAIRRSQLHLHRATVEDFFNSLLDLDPAAALEKPNVQSHKVKLSGQPRMLRTSCRTVCVRRPTRPPADFAGKHLGTGQRHASDRWTGMPARLGRHRSSVF